MSASGQIPKEDWEDFERLTKFLREHIDFSKNPIPLVPAKYRTVAERDVDEANESDID